MREIRVDVGAVPKSFHVNSNCVKSRELARAATAPREIVALAARHLRAVALEPRPAGGEAAARARGYCAETLVSCGFRVRERPFEYSALAGEYGTPLGGLVALAVVCAGAAAGVWAHAGLSLGLLVVGVPVLVVSGQWLARKGVLTLPAMRRRSVNLEAVRADEDPPLWLVAHIDSKSQPVPLLVRAGGIVLLAAAWIAALALATAQLTRGVIFEWRWVVLAAGLGAIPVLASTVGKRSVGAIDNASGVATLLTLAGMLPPAAPIGILITDAEELGLAGARAWCAGRSPGRAVNFDGLDDAGILTLMWTRPRSSRLEAVLRDAADAAVAPLRIVPLIPGVLVDAVALSDAGWEVVTLSRGTIGTLRRIHTRRDDGDALQGDGIAEAARVLMRAVNFFTEQA